MFQNKFYVDGGNTGAQPDFIEAYLVKSLLDNLTEDYTGKQMTEIEAALWKMVEWTIKENDRLTEKFMALLVPPTRPLPSGHFEDLGGPYDPQHPNEDDLGWDGFDPPN